MAEVFNTGMKILVIIASIFFFILLYFCSLWSQAEHPEKKYWIGALVSSIYTFMFFLAGFIFLSLFSFLWQFKEYFLSFLKFFSL